MGEELLRCFDATTWARNMIVDISCNRIGNNTATCTCAHACHARNTQQGQEHDVQSALPLAAAGQHRCVCHSFVTALADTLGRFSSIDVSFNLVASACKQNAVAFVEAQCSKDAIQWQTGGDAFRVVRRAKAAAAAETLHVSPSPACDQDKQQQQQAQQQQQQQQQQHGGENKVGETVEEDGREVTEPPHALGGGDGGGNGGGGGEDDADFAEETADSVLTWLKENVW